MAPARVAKRAASSVLAMPKKRGRPSQKQVVVEKCTAVAAAILAAPALPESVREMLAAMIPGSLSTIKEERHEMQREAVSMVQTALAAIETSLVEAFDKTQATLNALAEERAPCDSACASADVAVKESLAAIAARKTEAQEAAEALRQVKLALSEATDAESLSDRNLKDKAARKSRTEEVLRKGYAALKDGTAEDSKGAMAEVVSVSKSFEIEATLVKALSTTLRKAPDARGAFDVMTLQTFESMMDAGVSKLAASLAEAEPIKAERAAAVASAIAAREEAELACADRREAVASAQAEGKVCHAALQAAQAAAAALQPRTRLAEDAHAATERALACFREGPLATFLELAERAPAPLPEPPTKGEEESCLAAPVAPEEAAAGAAQLKVITTLPDTAAPMDVMADDL